MPPATLEAPTKAQNFKVLKPTGPWHVGDVFTLDQFQKLHPLRDTPEVRASVPAPDRYHDDLIDRLVVLGTIERTEAPATEAPIGPGSRPGEPVRNTLIDAAVKDAVDTKAANDLVKTNDLTSAKSGGKDEPAKPQASSPIGSSADAERAAKPQTARAR